ncbi:hypothetical protein TOC8171_48020 [Pseudomonas syringae]
MEFEYQLKRAVGRSSAWPYELECAAGKVNKNARPVTYQPGRKISIPCPAWLGFAETLGRAQSQGPQRPLAKQHETYTTDTTNASLYRDMQ